MTFTGDLRRPLEKQMLNGCFFLYISVTNELLFYNIFIKAIHLTIAWQL